MSLDRAKQHLADFIKWVMRGVDYHALYPATLQADSTDGFVDVLPDDERIKGSGMARVKIRHGVPGLRVQVRKGSRILIGFDNGDPQKPFATLWDSASVIRIDFGDDTLAAARQGDLTEAGGPGTVCTLWPVPIGVGAPPNNAIVAGMPCFISFDAVTPPIPLEAAPLYGAISTGSFKAGFE